MANYQPTLFEFAYFYKYEEAIKYLAEQLADKEDWDFTDTAVKKHSILKNYLEFTFKKLKQEENILYSTANKNACFNTGLVTQNLESIFAFFEKHRNPRPDSANFVFKAFVKESSSELSKHFVGKTPEAADFFEKPELLLFNPKHILTPDIDHIIEDNLNRFPVHLQNTSSDGLRRLLMGSIDEVKRKVKTNYKIAVPQYYKGKIQLLLPLCLTDGSPNPDLALVVDKSSDTTYTAKTCLTLKMAYNNARLIVKPQSSWLTT